MRPARQSIHLLHHKLPRTDWNSPRSLQGQSLGGSLARAIPSARSAARGSPSSRGECRAPRAATSVRMWIRTRAYGDRHAPQGSCGAGIPPDRRRRGSSLEPHSSAALSRRPRARTAARRIECRRNDGCASGRTGSRAGPARRRGAGTNRPERPPATPWTSSRSSSFSAEPGMDDPIHFSGRPSMEPQTQAPNLTPLPTAQ